MSNQWADNFQRLIQSGHRLPDIVNYTWSQFLAFSSSCQSLRQERRQELFTLLRIAAHGTDAEIKDLLKSLEN